MMLVLGIDPSAQSPGYAIWCTEQQRHVYVSSEPPSVVYVEHAAVEGGWHGPMGKQAMWGLGFDAAWRLCELRGLAIHGIYIVTPKNWRNAIPDRPGHHTIKDGLPKPVIVARLRERYRKTLESMGTCTDDMVEAMGIAEAVAQILQRPLKRDRKGLREVKR